MICRSLVGVHVPVGVVLVENGMRPVYQLDDVGLDANVAVGTVILLLLLIRVLIAAVIVVQDLVDVDDSLAPLHIGWHIVIPTQVVHLGLPQHIR